MADDDAIKRAAERIASRIVKGLEDIMNKRVSFLVPDNEMRLLLSAQRMLQANEKISKQMRLDLIRAIQLVWDHAKLLTQDDMDHISAGLDLLAEKEKEKEEKDTPTDDTTTEA